MAYLQAPVGGSGGSSRTKSTSSHSSSNVRPSGKTTSQSNHSDYSNAVNPMDAERKRKADEYKQLANGILQTATKIAEADAELNTMRVNVLASTAGIFPTIILGVISNIQKGINGIIDNLNGIGNRAAEKVQENGEVATYDNVKPQGNTLSREVNTATFSCDTDEVRDKIMPGLQQIRNKLKDASNDISKLPNLSGCEGTTIIPYYIEREEDLINKSYNEIQDMLARVEYAEKQNQNIIQDLLDRYDDINKTNAHMTSKSPSTRTTTYKGGSNTKNGKNNGIAEQMVDALTRASMVDMPNMQGLNFADISNLLVGLGEVAGIATLAAITGGTSLAGTSAAIAATSAMGKYTGQYWENARDSAEEGEKWATEETRDNGIVYGLANGIWEGAQWYVGASLGNLALDGVSDLGNAAIRVGIDTGFNALDTPYRTLIESVTSDETIQEAWENQGGWKAVFTNVGIGLIGSIGGEVIDLYRTRNGANSTKPEKVGLTMPEKIDVAKEKMKNYFDEHPDLGISEERLEEAFSKIVACETTDDFIDACHQLCPHWTDEKIKHVAAFRTSKKKWRNNNTKTK